MGEGVESQLNVEQGSIQIGEARICSPLLMDRRSLELDESSHESSPILLDLEDRRFEGIAKDALMGIDRQDKRHATVPD